MEATLQALIYLDGYGRFVWPSYLITFLYMGLDAWLAQRRLNNALKGLAQSSDSGEEDF